MVVAGWYEDPSNPNQHRYWDGMNWTDNVQPGSEPGAAQDATQIGDAGGQTKPLDTPGSAAPGAAEGYGAQPQFGGQGLAAGFAAGGVTPPVNFANAGQGQQVMGQNPNRLNDIGDWLGRTFKTPFKNLSATALFALLPAFLLFFLPYILFYVQASGLVLDDFDEVEDHLDFIDLVGTNTVLLPFIAFSILIFVVSAGGIAATHAFYCSDVGASKTLGESMKTGLFKLPKFIGLSILTAIPMFVLLGAAMVLIVAGAAQESAVLSILGALLYGLSYFVIMGYTLLKTSFLEVAVAMTPSGSSALKSMWNVSKGRAWAILGRQLLFILTSMLTLLVLWIVLAVIGAIVFSIWTATLDPDNAVTLGDYLPNPIYAFVFAAIYSTVIAVQSSLQRSAVATLYADAKMPNSVGHS